MTAEELKDDQFRLVYEEEDSDLRIYENKGAFPRAFVVRDWKVVQNERALLRELVSDQFQPKRLALLEEPASFSRRLRSSIQEEDKIEIMRYEASLVEISAWLKKPGLLVFTDSYFPGWRVYVDEKEKRIYQVDYILRGVFLSSGKHQVRFVYKPRSFIIGAIFSATSLLVMGVIWLGCLKKVKALSLFGR